MPDDAHSRRSKLRERILEYQLLGQLLRGLWSRSVTEVDVLRSDIDASGYDLVMRIGGITRHIQLKSSRGDAGKVSVSKSLETLPGGCVVWMLVGDDLSVSSFLWLGREPGDEKGGELPLSLDGFPVTRHSRVNRQGEYGERANHRDVPRCAFTPKANLDELIEALFGASSVALDDPDEPDDGERGDGGEAGDSGSALQERPPHQEPGDDAIVAHLVQRLIQEHCHDWTTQEIADEANRQLGSGVTSRCVSWYATVMRKRGIELPRLKARRT